MFHAAEAALLGEGLSFSKHAAVIAAFGQRFAKSGRLPQELHRSLLEAEASRRVGDYDVGLVLGEGDAALQIGRADLFLDAVERFLGGVAPPPRHP